MRNAQRMMSAVDGALRKVDAERGDFGATMNRMEHTIDNLSNIVVNTTVSRGRIEDADMAEEFSESLKEPGSSTGCHCDVGSGEPIDAISVRFAQVIGEPK